MISWHEGEKERLVENTEEIAQIIAIVCRLGNLESLEADRDFYDAGMSSLHALGLLLELEEAFSISIPDTEFMKARTVQALHAVVSAARTS
jgi:acyl carrier protein